MRSAGQPPGRRRLSALLLALALQGLAGPSLAASPGPVTVFAAASLHDVLNALSDQWQQETGGRVSIAYAGTSALARQLEQGAPADIFVSADQAWMDYLTDRGLIDPESLGLLARNELVLIAPAGESVPATGLAGDPPVIDAGFDFLQRLGDSGRLAMANADHVPAGRYGRQALESLGRFATVRTRMTYSANVRLALALVARKETPLGIVYASDASAEPAVRVLGRFAADSHAPIVYPAGLVRSGGQPQAAGFLRWLLATTHAKTLARFGFLAP